MQKWVVFCWALLALVAAEECPDGGTCEEGQTCCDDPANGYECCPFDQAECCGDHIHCCPADTICDIDTSSCVNATVFIPWVERASTDQPRLSKSFRMIKSYQGEEDDNICPDQSRCPPEFSCLRALTRFGCCPLAQGIPCSDGKHCCPEGHQCSEDSRSCIKLDPVTTVLCSDGVSECPDQTTCCENPEGNWGCCPTPKAVCCEDKLHCCPELSTCDVEHSKCISLSTKKEMPMWAKLPARIRAEWENKKETNQVTAEAVNDDTFEKTPEDTTVNTVSPSEEELSVSTVTVAAGGNDIPCNETVACQDGETCCKTKEGEWSCCPLPEAVCCDDFIHCCPKGKMCNLVSMTCDDDEGSELLVGKVPAVPRQGVQAGEVPCDKTASCPDGTTCCKNKMDLWSCCPLPEAVCCDDHEHCCPNGMTCDPTSTTCNGPSGSTPMIKKMPAFAVPALTTPATVDQSQATSPMQTGEEESKEPEEDEAMKSQEADEEEEEEEEEEEIIKGVEGRVQCDIHTSCPQYTTCCFMASSQKWGCCPLPEAVCCADGSHCCPAHYKCNEHMTACVKGEVVIPWYTKLPATTAVDSVQASLGAVHCDGVNQCPEGSTCCRLFTGEWGCCPLQNAMCCPDKEHCCPQGYTCNVDSGSCQKPIMLQLENVPLTPVYLPSSHRDNICDEETSCKDQETCCRTSAATWGCCPTQNAVCCPDMKHCCPYGFTCTESGFCVKSTGLPWHSWHVFLNNNKRTRVV